MSHAFGLIARATLSLGGLALVGAALLASSGGLAASKKPNRPEGKQLPAKVTFIDAPSSESPAARQKRLKIECKGRPNAGMCLGHAR